MSHKIKVQFGGAADSTVHDYSPDVRLYNKDGTPAIHGGMRFDSGGGSVGEFILIDDENKIPAGDAPPDDLHLAGHNPIWWIEDSPGYDSWLSVGWIDVKDVGRFGHPYSVARTWQASWADANKELDGITLLTAEARPAESDIDRINWAIATFYSGDPRPSTDLSTDSDYIATATSVTMPAKTYEAGTAAQDIIKDCAGTAGKVYGVIIHDASSASHKCFQYIDEEDHTTNLSAAKISDQLADWDPTDATNPVFEPHWLQGAAATEDPGELISGVVSTWKGGTVTVTDATHADDYNYYVIPINDDVSENATQATNYATAYLHSRWNEHVTHQPSIMVSPSQHPLIRAGMSIQIKSAASMGGQYLGTYQTRRIAEVNWEPGGQWNGSPFLWAHLQLDRPLRILSRPGPGKPGPQPPSGSCTDLTATLAPDNFDCDVPISTGSHWYQGTFDTDDGAGGYYVFHGLSNPWAGYAFSGTWVAGTEYTVRIRAWVDAGASPMVITLGFATGLRSFTADKVTLTVTSATPAFYDMVWTPSSTYVCDGIYNHDNVKIDMECTPSSEAGMYFDGDSVQACSGGEPPPASDDGTGSVGDNCTEYACADHKHPVQTAAVTPITDAGGYYTSTNVEGALQEAGASIAAGGAPTGADYLVGTAQAGLSAEIVVGTTPGGELGGTWASPTVDTTHSGSAHTDFIAKALVDAKGDLIVATGADTVTRLPVGTNDQRLVADSTQAAGVKWADASATTEADVRDAGRWELAVLTGSPPDPLYADGDYLYIWVSGA